MSRLASAFKIIAILAVLAGCASGPPPLPYAAPEGATSTLKSEILGGEGRHGAINIYVSEGRCGAATRKKLFHIQDSTSDPAGSVKIAANQPLRLEYMESAAGGDTCNISVDVAFENGKSYSLVGGFAYKSGPIPILTGTRMCQLGVQDDADKTLVSRKSTCSR